MPNLKKVAKLHSAGATVSHCSPFHSLPVYQNKEDLADDFIQQWVIPYYMEIALDGHTAWVEAIIDIQDAITPEVCHRLLGDFNWRTRLVGAYFAAVKQDKSFIDIIGTHLLKSEVCCVGHIYALVLAFFNTEQATRYLTDYLTYYLTRPDLYFDQKVVLEALLYLDQSSGTNYVDAYTGKWQLFRNERRKLEQQLAYASAKQFSNANGHRETLNNEEDTLSTEFLDNQITILRSLS